jgi:hypothetical protein
MYTYDSWKALIGRLQHMQSLGTTSELPSASRGSGREGEADSYGIGGDSSAAGGSDGAAGRAAPCRTLAGVLTLRGEGAADAGSSLSLAAADGPPPPSRPSSSSSGKHPPTTYPYPTVPTGAVSNACLQRPPAGDAHTPPSGASAASVRSTSGTSRCASVLVC